MMLRYTFIVVMLVMQIFKLAPLWQIFSLLLGQNKLDACIKNILNSSSVPKF